ncbi:unnamed protein product [Symbiodinium sp. KB8]|nr:unnamed protein product [Symbiodinium sp. KB8]
MERQADGGDGTITYQGREMTLEEMGRQPLPEAVQAHYEQFLEETQGTQGTQGESVEVQPGTPDSTEEPTMGLASY